MRVGEKGLGIGSRDLDIGSRDLDMNKKGERLKGRNSRVLSSSRLNISCLIRIGPATLDRLKMQNYALFRKKAASLALFRSTIHMR